MEEFAATKSLMLVRSTNKTSSQLMKAKEFPAGPQHKSLAAEVMERCEFLTTDLAAFVTQRTEAQLQLKLRRATPKPKTTSVSARFTTVSTLVDNGKANFGESMVAEAQQLKPGDKRKRTQVDRGLSTY
jgi:hypothetical protein